MGSGAHTPGSGLGAGPVEMWEQRAEATQLSHSPTCYPRGGPLQSRDNPPAHPPILLPTPPTRPSECSSVPTCDTGCCSLGKAHGSHTLSNTTVCPPWGPWLPSDSLPPAGFALSFLEGEMRSKRSWFWSLPLAGPPLLARQQSLDASCCSDQAEGSVIP